MSDVDTLIREVLPSAVALRHEIHQDPELAFQEHRTAERICRCLEALGALTIRRNVARTGVVAVLNADRPGPCVAFRADMDALPIHEQTNLPYASRREGVMHACGHDGHVACLVATAAVLARIREDLPGKVVFLFQPAEEGGGGARLMCEQGVLDDPKVDALFALHGWPNLPVGSIHVRAGPVLAGSRILSITIHGRGAHAAQPHQAVDPVVVAAHVITAIQNVVSRCTDPLEPVVVTIGRLWAGTAENIIPDQACMEGTVRALSEETLQRTAELVRRIATHTAEAFAARADVSLRAGYPATVNDAALAGLVEQVGLELLGPDAVVTDAPPTMGTEDFAYYAQRVPAVMFRLGIRPPGAADYPPGHSPRFDFNDEALPVGIRMLCGICRRFLAGSRG